MSKEILLISGNNNKVEEIKAITGLSVTARNLDIPEIQSLDIEEVARAKALAAFKVTGCPVLVDDTGMNIDALNGLPGALVTWFLETLKPEGILKLVAEGESRKALVATCIAYADESGVYAFTGVVTGKLADCPRGDNGFGYDPIFIPDGYSRTFAEMSADEKNAISMRKIALLKFRDFMPARHQICTGKGK